MNKTQERDQKLQELNIELTKKRNDIKRRKDAIALQKLNDLMAEDDAYCDAKRKKIAEIDAVRLEKSTYEVTDPLYTLCETKARSMEHQLSLLRNEHERNIHRISNRHMIARTALDDEDLELSEWQEEQKAAIMRDFMERKDTDDANEAQHEAE